MIPTARAASLVPLFGANDLDVSLEYNLNAARGFLFVHGLQVGGMHAELSGEEPAAERNPDTTEIKKKKGRTMYAETEREREMLATQIRASAWNNTGPCVSVGVGCTGADAVIQAGK